MICAVKSYGQRCSLARALDVVGERWSMLILRELTLGARRYRDLLDGLPGVPTNLLATRLKDLQAFGVITKRTLPAPAGVTVYELTEAGHALRPALTELREWGSRFGPVPAETDEVRPSWALMSASTRPIALPDGRTCELRIGAESFQLTAAESALSVHAGPAPAPDAVITMPPATLYALMMGRSPTSTITVTGDFRAAQQVLETLSGALG
jgi:DNA-binding HxlR family transcriptional regulator